MDADKYARSISLMCPVCGTRDFQRESEDGPFCCGCCERVFTKEELIQQNGEVIQAVVEEVKSEVVIDLTKELRASLGKAFRGSKYVRFK